MSILNRVFPKTVKHNVKVNPASCLKLISLCISLRSSLTLKLRTPTISTFMKLSFTVSPECDAFLCEILNSKSQADIVCSFIVDSEMIHLNSFHYHIQNWKIRPFSEFLGYYPQILQDLPSSVFVSQDL